MKLNNLKQETFVQKLSIKNNAMNEQFLSIIQLLKKNKIKWQVGTFLSPRNTTKITPNTGQGQDIAKR